MGVAQVGLAQEGLAQEGLAQGETAFRGVEPLRAVGAPRMRRERFGAALKDGFDAVMARRRAAKILIELGGWARRRRRKGWMRGGDRRRSGEGRAALSAQRRERER